MSEQNLRVLQDTADNGNHTSLTMSVVLIITIAMDSLIVVLGNFSLTTEFKCAFLGLF